jgi:hypothetical protein
LKTILVAISSLLFIGGCYAETPNHHQAHFIDPDDYTPPRHEDMTITAWDLQPKVVIDQKTEEQNYEASISHISEQMAAERLKMRMCLEVHNDPKDRYCLDLLKQLCQVDEFIDSRGSIHRKEYCDTVATAAQRHKD